MSDLNFTENELITNYAFLLLCLNKVHIYFNFTFYILIDNTLEL